MAEAIRSALFVDYESLNRSLAANGVSGDALLADRAAAWVAAIESGRLIGPEGTRRRVSVRRCYAGPSVLGRQRDALATAGFMVIDCSANDGAGRSSADLQIAMDTIDALAQPSGADEFILLSATELAPLLKRLKASKRMTAIFVDAGTAASDKALADAILDCGEFAAFLDSDEVPVDEEPRGAAAADRAEIETFARKVHAATNIPLFSPKTFAELFKHLTEEIKENGYHFQTTAKNVADRMTETGRSVTRRQVVFIVKGLALKGHVFSTTDTPDGLAEVFREQARYLITNAGVALDQRQEQLLSAWFMSSPAAQEPRPKAASANGAAVPNGDARPRPAVVEAPPEAPPPPPPAIPEPTVVKPVDLPKSAAKPISQMKTVPSQAAREQAKAVIAARIAASAKLKSAGKGTATARTAARQAAAAPAKPAQPQKRSTDRASEALESSILAAIAEAVDVLVDDNSGREVASADPPPRRRRQPEPARRHTEQEAEDAAADGSESGDIGDQIQRIIASYNRNRGDE